MGEVKNPEKAPPELIASVEKALMAEFVVEKSDLKEVLENQTDREPVFLVLPIDPGISVKWLEDLQDNFPGVTFFLLLGEHEIKKQNLSEEKIEILEPSLEIGSEDIF